MAQNRVACSYIESMLKQNVVGRSDLLPMLLIGICIASSEVTNVILSSMIRPRLKFETAEDRRKAAEKIRAEAEQASLLYVCLNCTTLVNQESNQPRHKTTVATCTRCPYQLI